MDAVATAISGIPKGVSLSAALSSAAYLDAKYGISLDLWTFGQAVRFGILTKRLEKKDRVNAFYRLEELATDPKSAHRIFLIFPVDPSRPESKSQWTYAEAYDTILRYAAWLKSTYKVQKEEIVAVDFTNSPTFVWLWWALWALGAKPAFINYNLRDNAFVHCVRISTARLLLVDPQIQDVLSDSTSVELSADGRGRAVETVVLDSQLQQQILSMDPYRPPNEVRSGVKISSAAILIYTSGTTGLPKAANVNWGKPLSGYFFWCRLLGLKADDRYFTAMPLYHSSASFLGICQVLGPGCTMVVAPKFSPRTYMRMVSDTKSTAVQYIGEMCRYLVSSPVSPYDRAHSVRVAFGNGMRPDVWQRYKDRFNIGTVIEFYAATEGPSTSIAHSRNHFLRGTIGRSGIILRTLATQVLIKMDPNTEEPYRDPQKGYCVKSKTNEPGELLYPLDANAIGDKYHGYLGNEKATNSKILRDVFKKGDAYYRTGDLQRLDEEGRWWFVDRLGDTFRWKSENVSTAEVADAVGMHPSIKEANVYGVQLPNHDGRAGCAALTLENEQKLDAALARDLAAHSRKRLPKYAVPIFLRVVHEVEVTGTMKHQKVVLRNEGVDPAKTKTDEVFWLPPGAEAYQRFDGKDWQRIVGGSAKL